MKTFSFKKKLFSFRKHFEKQIEKDRISFAEVAPDPESAPAGFCVFLSDPDPESKLCEKPDPESLFNSGSGRSLCGHSWSKNMGKSGLDRWL